MYAASFFKRVVNIPRSLCLVVGGVMSVALYLEGVMTVNPSGPFYDHFCTKTDDFDFEVATSECHQNPKTTTVQINRGVSF